MKLFKLWTEKEYEDVWIDLDSLDDAKINNVSATFSQAVDKYLIASQVSWWLHSFAFSKIGKIEKFPK